MNIPYIMGSKIPCPRGQRYSETSVHTNAKFYMYVKNSTVTKLEGSWNPVLVRNFVYVLLYRKLRLVGHISF